MSARPIRSGMPKAPASEFEERVVQIDRVARVMRGGRRFRFRATVVVGDRKRRVGLGIAKAGEVQGAIQKAVAVAKKDLIEVKTLNDTIPFATLSRFAGARLMLKPARPGTGIIAGGAVRPVVELAGITNILAKSLGSDNRINNAKAAIVALKEIAATDITRLMPADKPVRTPVKKAVKAKAASESGEGADESESTQKEKASAKKTPAKKPAAKKAAAAKPQKAQPKKTAAKKAAAGKAA